MSTNDDLPSTTPLGLHLLSEHRLGNAHLLTPEEQSDIHGHEHAGPGTIRSHPAGDRNWSVAKVRETLRELREDASIQRPACPVHGEHPYGDATCLDCPACSRRPSQAEALETIAHESWPPNWATDLVEEFGAVKWFKRRGDSIIMDTTKRGRVHSCVTCWPRLCDHASMGTPEPSSLPARLTREFHEKFRLPIDDVSRTTNAFRAKLIREEAAEAAEAVEASNHGHLLNRRHVAKELADAVIALYGTAVTMGIDLDAAVRLVHASNMTKVDEDGKPIIRADGKVMKGPNYRPPDMQTALRPLGGERG